jgi:hypothetical protein
MVTAAVRIGAPSLPKTTFGLTVSSSHQKTTVSRLAAVGIGGSRGAREAAAGGLDSIVAVCLTPMAEDEGTVW